MWRVPKIWEGGDVWIIGGGPSVPKQFGVSDRIIQGVIEGTTPPSAYSPYMEYLHNKHVIGINVAYMIGNWMDIIFFGDKGFFLTHQADLAKYPGLKISCHHTVATYNWVKELGRDSRKKNKGISINPSLVCWNGNSGGAAISVAANAGAKRIILVGFDMKLSDSNRQHWHDHYNRGVIVNKRYNTLPFERHLRGFKEIDVDARKRGIEIINACPDSTIVEFRKTTVKELMNECS
jgi:hypothetical protein